MAFLICQLGGGHYVDFELPNRPLTIGRSPQADMRIADERISRIHCGIRHEGDSYVIRDLGSTNGTFLNDRRIHESPLRFGDTIKVGHTLLAFESRPRQQATSRLPEVIEVELPDQPFAEAVQRLSQQASRVRPPQSTSPSAQ